MNAETQITVGLGNIQEGYGSPFSLHRLIRNTTVTTVPPGTKAEPCARIERGQGCGVERCGLCEARAVSICNAIEEDQLSELARATTVVELAPGEVFRNEGASPEYLFNIISGSVKLFKLLADGRRAVIGFLTVGDFIGFGRPDAVPCSAEALTNVRLCRFERGKFRVLLETYPKLERRLLAVASDEVAAGQEHMTLLGRLTADERVARFLLARAEASQRLGGSSKDLELPMTRSDIADYLGLTIETVSRVFTRLRRKGLIDYKTARSVTLQDRPGLLAISEGG
ncbi:MULTISPECIES: Crp/Fnr family transcriptional regulator [Methylorubrum]|uniref:CRP/FNR family transcriptional regulator n=2 Tax=Methylorubrum TaxID=2282523 RepID=A0AA40S7U3_9HYPH|nr:MULTISPECIES: helix-turn-helix domain-containing protein [Methylorubrum]MBA8916030.1 CRP/FNR family transcriptional regulator [Methylorubrum thiocyanatum]UGB28606.1 helix-turn-helix domain-containing protein [Methylorubrum sp. B1-46]